MKSANAVTKRYLTRWCVLYSLKSIQELQFNVQVGFVGVRLSEIQVEFRILWYVHFFFFEFAWK